MLDLMRRHAQSWFIKVLLGGIVVTFISWGGYSRYAERSNTVAYVNGEPLGIQDYEGQFQRVLEFYRAQMGERFDEAAVKALGLRQKVYDDLIDRMLMLQEANRLGLMASAAEVRAQIAKMQVFQTEGRFDEERYRKLLAANQMTPTQFEEEQRAQITAENLRRLVIGFAKVSEAEAFLDWRLSNEQATVDYATFQASDFESKVQISEADMAKYYEARKEGFRKPPKVRLGWVELNKEAIAASLPVSEDRARQEYNEYKDDYWTGRQVKARHILLAVPAGASKEVERQIEQRAAGLAAQAKAGADFSELARKNSQDPGSAAKGGDLGWFGEGQMVEAFDEAAFALPKGGLGGPVRTEFGYHIIKVDDVRPSRLRSFEEARPEIVKELSGDAADDLIEKRIEESYGQVPKLGGLKAYAASRGLAYQETGLLAAGQAVPGLAGSAQVVTHALNKKKGDFEVELERQTGPVFVQVLERQEGYIPQLSEVAAQVRTRMASEKAMELAATAAASGLAELRGGATLAQAAAKHGGKTGRVGPFRRSNPPAELGRDATLAAFRLSPEQPVGRSVHRNGQGFVLLRLVEKKAATIEEFAGQKEQAMQRLLTLKKSQMFDSWLKQLRQKADIEVVNKVS